MILAYGSWNCLYVPNELTIKKGGGEIQYNPRLTAFSVHGCIDGCNTDVCNNNKNCYKSLWNILDLFNTICYGAINYLKLHLNYGIIYVGSVHIF